MSILIMQELNPFTVPDTVTVKMLPRSRQEGFITLPTYKLSELSEDVLSQLCDEFRASVFTNAGKVDPNKKF